MSTNNNIDVSMEDGTYRAEQYEVIQEGLAKDDNSIEILIAVIITCAALLGIIYKIN
jgi:major membrane immunogen (membrane-anchored lipoprotein)